MRFLKPTFAPKRRVTVGGRENAIRGSDPAVCFTEQPLSAFLKSCHALGSRYHPYGIAVRKEQIFRQGGRPVIYGDKSMLDMLPAKMKYLWVRFNPIPETSLGGYPLDWTHEREWRAKPKVHNYYDYGSTPADTIPLMLPPDIGSSEKLQYLPWVLVKSRKETEELRGWIAQSPECEGSSGVFRLYSEHVNYLPIIPLEEIEQRVKNGDERWTRIDTRPFEEFDPEGSAHFKRFGWRQVGV